MLANLFSKTKPINYLIIFILLFFIFFLVQFTGENLTITWSVFFQKILLFFLLFFSVFLVHFISHKNKLTKDNNYSSLLYLSFLILLPSVLVNNEVIIANFFIILALRRIFSMHSLIDIKKKIFDAALWIFVATIFHFWCILFILLLFLSIFYYGSRDYKNLIIPFISFATIAVFLGIYTLVTNSNQLYIFSDWTQTSFDFTTFKDIHQNMALFAFSAFAIIFFVSQALNIPKKTFNKQIIYKKILVLFLIGVSVYSISPDKNNGSIIFTFFPVAILGANYLENKSSSWFKETILYCIISISIFSYICQLL